MSHRCLFATPALMVLAALTLFLGGAPSGQNTAPAAPAAPAAEPQKDKFFHIRICLWEIRQAKEDARMLQTLNNKRKQELLGILDGAANHIKNTWKDMGGDPQWDKPLVGKGSDEALLRLAS